MTEAGHHPIGVIDNRYGLHIVITLCVLLEASPGRDVELARYEDEMLELLREHDASVIVRLTPTDHSFSEIQVLEFGCQDDLDNFQADPRRLALSEMREVAIATTTVIPCERVA